jgi:hypothetical protein
MRWALYDIDYMLSEATSVQENIYQFLAAPWEDDKVRFDSRALAFTFEQAVPTLLIMKLSAAVEDALNVLWSIRFPEVDPRRLRHDDKLAVIEKLHRIDAMSIRALWKLRNDCAHSVKKMATRADFEKHFENVERFLATFKHPERPARRRVAQTADDDSTSGTAG